MGSSGTFLHILMRAAFALSLAALPGCLVDDPAPCTIQDSQYPDPECLTHEDPAEPLQFKVTYTTANGTRPDGRYGYFPPNGVTVSQAETLAKHALQFAFNTSQAYVDFEVAEIAHYRGDVCGTGFRLKDKIGEIRVKKTRQGVTVNQYDYDLELTCIEN